MAAAVALYRSSVGKKVVMALTGFILIGFVVAHMIGNLEIFRGEEHLNAYALFLREVGAPIFARGQVLWILRIVLLVSVVLHMVAAYQLTHMSQASRPVRYAHRRVLHGATGVPSYAARTMRWGGIIIFFFVIYHLLHFTTGTVHPGFNHENVYRNVVSGFQVWYVSAFYIVAMVALGLHLDHGIWSMFQTLGLNNRRVNSIIRGFAMFSAAAVVLGNISIPIAVLTGFLE